MMALNVAFRHARISITQTGGGGGVCPGVHSSSAEISWRIVMRIETWSEQIDSLADKQL
jgi:hypothetical protein